MDEIKRLDNIATDSWYTGDVPTLALQYCTDIFARHIISGSILEMGPAEGIATDILAKTHKDITLLEGSSVFCNELKKRYPDFTVVNSLFEEYKPERKFDNIILGHVLEHVENPVEILKLAASWLSDKGKIMCAVPNSNSLHRQAAVLMGLIDNEKSFSEKDTHHGHRRIYAPEILENDFTKAGLKIEKKGGYWIKPLSDKQLQESWTNEMLNAFMQLGERYPDIAAEIYIIAKL